MSYHAYMVHKEIHTCCVLIRSHITLIVKTLRGMHFPTVKQHFPQEASISLFPLASGRIVTKKYPTGSFLPVTNPKIGFACYTCNKSLKDYK